VYKYTENAGGEKVPDITIDIHNYPANVNLQDICDMLKEFCQKQGEVMEQLDDDLRAKDEQISDLKHKYFQF
jgi:hypothetical protein